MPDSFKDIPLGWYAAAIIPVLGWVRTAYKAGQTTQDVFGQLKTISKDQASSDKRNTKNFEKIYDEMGDLKEQVAEMRGQLK